MPVNYKQDQPTYSKHWRKAAAICWIPLEQVDQLRRDLRLGKKHCHSRLNYLLSRQDSFANPANYLAGLVYLYLFYERPRASSEIAQEKWKVVRRELLQLIPTLSFEQSGSLFFHELGNSSTVRPRKPGYEGLSQPQSWFG
jgi:hypothetical protein